MIDKRIVETIGFDADDTLWENNNFYIEVSEKFYEIMRRYCSDAEIRAAFVAREEDNIAELGYGAKAVILSMIETAIRLYPSIESRVIEEIIEAGRVLFRVPTIMLPNVCETIEALQKKYRVIIITKGEVSEQSRKFDNSPLPHDIPYFILGDKSPESYRRLLKRENIPCESFLMVGNSPRSDVLAPVEIGAQACYIPYHTTWAHEDMPIPEHERIATLSDIGDLRHILL